MKEKLILKVLHYNDEAPREVLRSMKVGDLEQYVKDLRETYPELVASEPE
jgi:hypothetical protein